MYWKFLEWHQFALVSLRFNVKNFMLYFFWVVSHKYFLFQSTKLSNRRPSMKPVCKLYNSWAFNVYRTYLYNSKKFNNFQQKISVCKTFNIKSFLWKKLFHIFQLNMLWWTNGENVKKRTQKGDLEKDKNSLTYIEVNGFIQVHSVHSMTNRLFSNWKR